MIIMRVLLLCRRSAVSRQACQLICVLSQAMGSHFDSLAVQILPALFKVLVITVQVRTTVYISRPELVLLPVNRIRLCALMPSTRLLLFKPVPGTSQHCEIEGGRMCR